MSSKNYERGRALEYRVMDQLKTRGYLTIRAASSHGVFDVAGIGFDPYGEIYVYFIQVKRTRRKNMSPDATLNLFNEEKNKIEDIIPKDRILLGLGNILIEFWLWLPERKWMKWRLTQYGEWGRIE